MSASDLILEDLTAREVTIEPAQMNINALREGDYYAFLKGMIKVLSRYEKMLGLTLAGDDAPLIVGYDLLKTDIALSDLADITLIYNYILNNSALSTGHYGVAVAQLRTVVPIVLAIKDTVDINEIMPDIVLNNRDDWRQFMQPDSPYRHLEQAVIDQGCFRDPRYKIKEFYPDELRQRYSEVDEVVFYKLAVNMLRENKAYTSYPLDDLIYSQQPLAQALVDNINRYILVIKPKRCRFGGSIPVNEGQLISGLSLCIDATKLLYKNPISTASQQMYVRAFINLKQLIKTHGKTLKKRKLDASEFNETFELADSLIRVYQLKLENLSIADRQDSDSSATREISGSVDAESLASSMEALGVFTSNTAARDGEGEEIYQRPGRQFT